MQHFTRWPGAVIGYLAKMSCSMNVSLQVCNARHKNVRPKYCLTYFVLLRNFCYRQHLLAARVHSPAYLTDNSQIPVVGYIRFSIATPMDIMGYTRKASTEKCYNIFACLTKTDRCWCKGRVIGFIFAAPEWVLL